MYYLRLLLLGLWMVVPCLAILILSLFRGGDPELGYYFAQIYWRGAARICGLKVSFEGLEHMGPVKPRVFVANHQSGVDMATFGPVFPHRTVVVAKRELLWVPFFGLVLKATGSIILNRQKAQSAVAGLKAAAQEMIERQVSVWIFPEGTRNRSSDLLGPFKKGAFHLAIQARVPIVPMVCSPLSPVWSSDQKRSRSGHLQIRVLEPIDTSSYGEKDVDQLMAVVRAKMLEAAAVLKTTVG